MSSLNDSIRQERRRQCARRRIWQRTPSGVSKRLREGGAAITNNGLDIFVLARTDALVLAGTKRYAREDIPRCRRRRRLHWALPDKESMSKAVEEVGIPTFANIIEDVLTENLSARDLAELGFEAVAYPWTLVAANLKSIRETQEELKRSMTVGAPPQILSYEEVYLGRVISG